MTTAEDMWAGADLAQPPHSIEAERRVLAAMIDSGEAIDVVGEVLLPEHFWRPAHQVLYLAMIKMRACREPVDCVTLREWVAREMGEIRALGGHDEGARYLIGLAEWVTDGPVSVMGPARIVLRRAILRRALEVFTRGLQIMHSDDGEDPVALVARAQQELDRAVAYAAEGDDPLSGPVTVDAFTTMYQEERAPVIPGLLHQRDRLVVVSTAGTGKTTLVWQMGVCAAAGDHPFEHKPIPPQRVLLLDGENPRDLAQATLRKMLALARGRPGWDPDRLHIWSVPEGLDITQARDAYRLAAAIRKVRPTLIAGGPAYKLIEDDGDRRQHAALTKFLDEQRMRMGFALALETHTPAPQGRVVAYRPAGTSRWANWPEFGRTMEPGRKKDPAGTVIFGRFRQDRAAGRCWPVKLTRGTAWGGGWPWEAVYEQGTIFDE